MVLLLLLQGLWDQAMALTWVRDHISSFGGDPNNVTLIGEGSGAVCAGYHVVSPRSTGLFSKVVLMSGSPVSPACRDGDGVVNDGNLANLLQGAIRK